MNLTGWAGPNSEIPRTILNQHLQVCVYMRAGHVFLLGEMSLWKRNPIINLKILQTNTKLMRVDKIEVQLVISLYKNILWPNQDHNLSTTSSQYGNFTLSGVRV